MMAFKLSKTQLTSRDQFIADLREMGEAVNAAIVKFNETVTEAGASVAAALEIYNDKLEEAREFLGTVAEDARNEFDEKSEKWQESEKGQEVQSWVEAWETVDITDIEIAFPDDLDEIDADEHAAALEELPDSP